MAMPAASHTTCLRALIVASVFAVLVADVGGRNHVCPPFFCGSFSNLSYPFRQQGDPYKCGVQSYELVCTDTNATIHISSGTYYVVDISPTYFWVVDTNLDLQSSCPLPRWDYHDDELAPYGWVNWATFMNCSKVIMGMQPVNCLSTDRYFIYVLTWYHDTVSARNFPPSCGYLATTPLGGPGMMPPDYASYQEVVDFMRKGFALRFLKTTDIRECLAEWMREFREGPRKVPASNIGFLAFLQLTLLSGSALLLAPLAIFIFLAHKYWKTGIIDAIEKFLQMQQMLGGPLRFANTDLTAITSHFRGKLGQGGYGSVYKGVLLPGEAQVAVKMLSNSKCNGEELISEIHNWQDPPYQCGASCGDKSFSWDKLNEIALGIARGVNYLHQGWEAPEMVSRSFGIISSKFDVYSFGMLLLEMAGGRRNANPNAATSSQAQAYCPSLVYSQFTREEVGKISEDVDMHELEKKLCIVGLWCIQMKPHDRLTMSEAIEMLEAGVDGVGMPLRPFFCDEEEADSYHMSSELNAIEEDE
ncbi:hypothetical protein BAE44_0002107 [Dichanthelium oligosanthes]|uniref:Wall-associated receptor kinase galacturonan-binding domain-containing protein n=1 Tax=Dichanthelium oligosanthes TaxID=888268 RepID=A0A1E5WHK3_9POAL|nr:hypothetical protein BAE44_0002107 [Dichanthelium oligosanthes]